MKKLIRASAETLNSNDEIRCKRIVQNFMQKLIQELHRYDVYMDSTSIFVPGSILDFKDNLEIFKISFIFDDLRVDKDGEKINTNSLSLITYRYLIDSQSKDIGDRHILEGRTLSFDTVEQLKNRLNHISIPQWVKNIVNAISMTQRSIQISRNPYYPYVVSSSLHNNIKYEIIRVMGDRGEPTEFEESEWVCENDLCALTRALVDPDEDITSGNYESKLENSGYDADSVSLSYLEDQLDGRELYDGAVIYLRNTSSGNVLYEDEYFMNMYEESKYEE